MGKHSGHDNRKNKSDDKRDDRDDDRRKGRDDDRDERKDRDDDRGDRRERDTDRDDRKENKNEKEKESGRDGKSSKERDDDDGRGRSDSSDDGVGRDGGDRGRQGHSHSDDDVVGTDHCDVIATGKGDDRIEGAGGNDILIGGSGTDTAIYAGSATDYAWVGWGNVGIVQDRNKEDGNEGTDLLVGIEKLEFNDFTYEFGKNNAALVKGDDVTTDEDSGVSLSFTALDFDCGKVSVESVTVSGGGSISLVEGSTPVRAGMGKGAEFELNFEPGDAYQYLEEGQSVTETVTVVVSDGQGAYTTKTFEVTIEGRADAPAVVQPLEATVGYDADPATQEDGITELTGQITSTGGEGEKSYSVVSGGALGLLTVAADGSFAYALDNDSAATQSLAEGESVVESFQIEVTDAAGNVETVTVELTVAGTNDAPTIASAGAPVAANAAAPTVSGQVQASDIDNGDVLSYALEGDGQGSYGSITMNAETGAWEFTADPSAQAFQALGANESAVQQFVVEVSDGKGGTATDIIAIEIQGTNDGPVIDGVSYLNDQVAEDGVLTASGQIEASDADANDSLAYAAEAPQGSYGALEVNPATGEWTYSLDNAAAQSLSAGEILTEEFVVSVTDESGAVATSTVSVTITGTNDAPEISSLGTPAAPVSEAAPTVTGQVVASDVDANDVLSYAVDGPAAGDYGSLTLDPATGEWSFTADPNAPAMQALGAGETATQTFTVTVSDGQGGTISQELAIGITGSNTAPVLEVVSQDVSALTEDGVITATGKVQGSDADANDTLAYSASAGTYGTPTVDANGNWSYALNNDAAEIQALGVGESLTESFEIIVTDAEGATDTVTIELTVTGTNDAPEISSLGEPAAPASEAAPTVTGQIAATDVDANDVLSYAVDGPAAGDYGALTLDPSTGAWSFSVDANAPAVQALGAGETATQTFTVSVSDGNGGTVSQELAIQITGSNSAPSLEIVSQDVSALTEDGVIAATGRVQGSDADANDSLAYAASGASYGTASVDANGNWSYALNNNAAEIQALGVGESLTESFEITVTDAQGATDTVTIELTVTGTNDAPEISSLGTPAGVSEEVLVTTGSVVASDVDANDVLSYAVQDAINDYGSFSIDPATGDYQFTLDPNAPAVQALGAGDVATQDFIIEVADGKGGIAQATVSISITGGNAAPVIESVQKSSDPVEDVTTTVTGSVTASDVDAGDTLTYAIDSQGTNGTAAIDAQGNWTYDLANGNAAVQALGAGEVMTESFVVSVTDAQGAVTTETVELTIIGTNDVPSVVSSGTGVANEATPTATGQVIATDVDANDVLSYSTDLSSGTYGSLSVDGSTGEWQFTLNPNSPATLALGAGETAVEEFEITISDGQGGFTSAIVPITIEGTNGVPVITSEISNGERLAEDGTSIATGTIVASDPDANDVLTYSAANGGSGTYGSLAIDAQGNWTYTVNQAADAVQALGVGETATEEFTIEVTDPHGGVATATVSVSISGTNDAPVASAVSPVVSATEAAPTLSGQVVASDVDANDVLSYQTGGSGVGTHGSLSVDPSTGRWTFTLDPNAPSVQALGAGETATEDFVIEVRDDKGEATPVTVTITIEGSNDAPVITNTTTTNTATFEDSPTQASGQVFASDPDGDALTFGVENAASAYGTFAVDAATGEWTYTIDSTLEATQALANGQLVWEEFAVTATDALGGQASTTVRISVGGSNDAPVVENVTYSAGNTATEQASILTGQVVASDIDATDVLTYTVFGGGAGTYGSLALDENGNWTYTGDDAAIQGLGAGETATETFTIVVSDGTGTYGEVMTEVTINVEGTNSAPVVSEVWYDNSTLTEDSGTYTATGYILSSDPDANDRVVTSVIGNGQGAYGSLVIDEYGSFAYVADNASSAVQGLGAGETVEDAFHVQLSDGNGGVISQRLAFNVVGVNDAPIVDGITYNNGGVAQEDVILESAGTINVSDLDASDTFIFTPSNGGQGQYGSLNVTSSGDFRYTLNNDAPEVQALDGGQFVNDTFTIDISDGNGGTTTATLSFSIEGSADIPMTILNFEGLYAAGKSKMPAGYGGFDWDANTSLVQGINYGSGWNNGTTSGKNAMFDAYGNGMSFTRGGDVFDFEKMNIAAANELSATAVVTGLLNGEIVGIQEFEITRTESREIYLDDAIFDFVDEVRIDGAGPVVMDDLGFYL